MRSEEERDRDKEERRKKTGNIKNQACNKTIQELLNVLDEKP